MSKVERKIRDEIMEDILRIGGISLQNQQQFVEKVKASLAIPAMKEILESRKPASWIKNLGGLNTWSNRELEWYLAEDRLLFACLSDEECDRWVCMLNWLIQKNK